MESWKTFKYTAPSRDQPGESETEDEEVKMNCVGGLRGINDSDMNTTEDEEDGDEDKSDDEESSSSDDDCEESRSECDGVVSFISRHQLGSSEILVRPKATPANRRNLSPLEEEVEVGSEESFGSSGSINLGLLIESLPSGRMSEDEESSGDESNDNDDDETLGESVDILGVSAAEGEAGDDEEELSNIVEAIEGMSKDFDSSMTDLPDRFIGVTRDRQDMLTVPKTKRVLSFNTLATLSNEPDSTELSPKRLKGLFSYQSFGSAGPPTTELDLMDNFTKQRRRLCPLISDEELDRQLEDELGLNGEQSRESTPVPLLTPPESPLTIEINGDKATVCEWPSNLAVDSAITAVISEIRPMSPESLQEFEREEGDRVAKEFVGASALTPLLRNVYVGR